MHVNAVHTARFTLSANTRHSYVVSLLVLGVFGHMLLFLRLLSSDLVIYFSRYLFDLVRYVVLNSGQLSTVLSSCSLVTSREQSKHSPYRMCLANYYLERV